MAGGSGTRLWPLSREAKPKQFHKLNSEKSLLQETYERAKDLVPRENIYISIGPKALEESKKQLPDIPKENFIVEPIAKNTAPGIAYVTAKIFSKDPDAIIATIASDHTVTNNTNFAATFTKAFNFVKDNPSYLVTIGIKPDSPHIGYGYIKVGRKFNDEATYKVDKFEEKPNLDTAKKYFESGDYLWNASYFIFRADAMLDNFQKLVPEIYNGLSEMLKAFGKSEELSVTKKVFDEFPKIPIDTAIAEKVEDIAVIPADLGWSDVGSWASVYDLITAGPNGVIRQGEHIGVNDKNCLFFAQDKLLATVGLEDIIIVDTPDVTLVCNKNRSQEVKDLIDKIKEEGKNKYL